MCATVNQARVIHLLRTPARSLGLAHRSLVVPYRYKQHRLLGLDPETHIATPPIDMFPSFHILTVAVVALFQV